MGGEPARDMTTTTNSNTNNDNNSRNSRPHKSITSICRPGRTGWLRSVLCCCGPLSSASRRRAAVKYGTDSGHDGDDAMDSGSGHGNKASQDLHDQNYGSDKSSVSFSSTAYTSLYSEFDDKKNLQLVDGQGASRPAAELSVKAEPEMLLYPRRSTVSVTGIVSLLGGHPGSRSSARPPVSLCAVLDRSGSMGGAKIKLVKKTADFMVSQLISEDKFGLITYSEKVAEDLPLMSMNAINKTMAREEIKNIRPGGLTNIHEALQVSLARQYQSAANSSNKAASDDGSTVRSVFLLTDGHPTCGRTDVPGILSAVTEARNSSLGGQHSVKVNTFGFGSDHDPELLGRIAEEGGGTYYYIEKNDQVGEVFGEALGGLLSMACQEIQVTISPLPGAKLKAVTTDYCQENLEGGAVKIYVGDMYFEEAKDLLLEVEADANPPLSPNSDLQTLLDITVSYWSIEDRQMKTVHASMSIRRPEEVAEDDPEQLISETVQFHKARLATSKALEEAQAHADRGELKKGHAELAQVRDMLKVHRSKVQGGNAFLAQKLQRLVDDVELTMPKFEDRLTYSSEGKKRAYMLSKAHSKQRSCGTFAGREGTKDYQTGFSFAMQAQASASVSMAEPPVGDGQPGRASRPVSLTRARTGNKAPFTIGPVPNVIPEAANTANQMT